MNGDRLTRAEFERRYSAMPQVKKAELIDGIVYMPSPVRFRSHGHPHLSLSAWIATYASKTPGLNDFGDNATTRLDEHNEFQPDVLLMLPKRVGGLAVVDEDDYVSGPPTLACEIAASSVSIDMHLKLNVYRRSGVLEYLVWRTEDQAVEWFALREGRYVAMPADANGYLKSEQFPGLWLNVTALLKGDLAGLLKGVDEGTASAEHAEFVKRLQAP
jgi:Uma2 family endonuclease